MLDNFMTIEEAKLKHDYEVMLCKAILDKIFCDEYLKK